MRGVPSGSMWATSGADPSHGSTFPRAGPGDPVFVYTVSTRAVLVQLETFAAADDGFLDSMYLVQRTWYELKWNSKLEMNIATRTIGLRVMMGSGYQDRL